MSFTEDADATLPTVTIDSIEWLWKARDPSLLKRITHRYTESVKG